MAPECTYSNNTALLQADALASPVGIILQQWIGRHWDLGLHSLWVSAESKNAVLAGGGKCADQVRVEAIASYYHRECRMARVTGTISEEYI